MKKAQKQVIAYDAGRLLALELFDAKNSGLDDIEENVRAFVEKYGNDYPDKKYQSYYNMGLSMGCWKKFSSQFD